MWLLCWQEEKHYISPQLQTTLAYVPFNPFTILFNKNIWLRPPKVFFRRPFWKKDKLILNFFTDAFPYLGMPVLTKCFIQKCLLVSWAQPQFLFYPNFNQLYHLKNIKIHIEAFPQSCISQYSLALKKINTEEGEGLTSHFTSIQFLPLIGYFFIDFLSNWSLALFYHFLQESVNQIIHRTPDEEITAACKPQPWTDQMKYN